MQQHISKSSTQYQIIKLNPQIRDRTIKKRKKENGYHPIEIRNEANDSHNGESRVGRINQRLGLYILRWRSRRKNQRVENARADRHSDRRVGRELCPALSIPRPPLNQAKHNLYNKLKNSQEKRRDEHQPPCACTNINTCLSCLSWL